MKFVMKFLQEKRGLVVGIANRHFIAAGCARAFCDAGAQLDFILLSIAYCPKEDLHGRITDCSRDGLAGLM